MKEVKRIVICLLLLLVIGIGIIGYIIYSPVHYTNSMLMLGQYPSVVSYYNKSDMDEGDKERVDSIITGKIERTFEAWNEYMISYDEAERIMEPFLEINDSSIQESVESHLSYMKIENTGNECIAEAEAFLGDNDYLQAMKCLGAVDESYSGYQSLQAIYDESKEILLDETGNPITEDDYTEAIEKLEGYISVVEDADFVNRKDKLEKELAEYEYVHEIIQTATEAYENEKYKESFSILERGSKKYPDSNKIKYATSAYQYAYILTVTGEAEMLLEDEDYSGAISLLEAAIENYDCEAFQNLLESIKRKDSFLYNIGASLSDAGDYVFTSAKKMVLGDFAEDEEETLLSLGGSVAASVAGVDAPLDARDLAYDITHWGEGDYFAARFALDVIGVIPFIGAVKYLKHLDTVADVADTVHDIGNAADAVHDIGNAVDTAHDATNIADTIHDVANVGDTAHDIVNTADAVGDISKQIDEVVDEVVEDVAKKADIVPDLADDFSDVTKAVDKAEDVADTAQEITKKGGSYAEVFKPGEGDLFEVHHMPADSVSDLSRKEGPAIKMSKEDHRMTASCGSSFEAMQYKEMQKELIEQGRFLDAVQMDIDDIRLKFEDKYDDAIDEMMEYIDQLIQEGVISG